MMMSQHSKNAIMRTVLATLTDTCDIEDATGADDGLGSETLTWSKTSTEPCRMTKPAQGEESISADTLLGRQPFTLQLKATAVIQMTSRVKYSGVYYEVVGIKGPVTDQFIKPVFVVKIG